MQEQLPENVKLLETDPEASQDPRSISISPSTTDLFIGGRDFTFQVNSLPSSDECHLKIFLTIPRPIEEKYFKLHYNT